MKKIVLATLVGAVVVFVWNSIAHVALPIGTIGLSSLPNEEPVLQSLAASVHEPGLYFFPAIDMKAATKEQRAVWEKKLHDGPSGLLVYRPHGGEAIAPWQLIHEFLANLLEAAIVAFLLSMMAASYGRRVLATTLLGLFGSATILLSYWIWYGFPALFVLGEIGEHMFGWLLAGLVMARMIPPAGGQR